MFSSWYYGHNIKFRCNAGNWFDFFGKNLLFPCTTSRLVGSPCETELWLSTGSLSNVCAPNNWPLNCGSEITPECWKYLWKFPVSGFFLSSLKVTTKSWYRFGSIPEVPASEVGPLKQWIGMSLVILVQELLSKSLLYCGHTVQQVCSLVAFWLYMG